MQPFPLSQLLWAGGIAGIAGLITFLVVHHFTISPIWFIFPVGALMAAAGGAAVGWAFELMQPRLPASLLLASLVFALLLTLTQVPGFLLSSRREPILDMETATFLPGRGREAAGRFVLDLFLTAGLVGGLLGWWLGGTPAAALRMAVAALAYSVGPGHNIPFFAGTSGCGKMWAIMLLVILASALTFAGALVWFRRS